MVNVNFTEIESLNYLFERVMGKIFLTPYSTTENNEMSGAQKRIFYFLDLEGPRKMSEIAQLVNVSLPAATQVVDRLVRAGLVERVPDANDRRVIRIAFTREGEQTMKKIKAVHERRLKEVLEKLDAQERVELVEAFEKIHSLLNQIDLRGQS